MTESRHLHRIQANDHFRGSYLDTLGKMFSLGVFEFLREQGKVSLFRSSTTEEAAAEAHRSRGYNECLDDLLYFLERFLPESSNVTSELRPSYAAENLIKDRDYVTTDDFNILSQK